MRWGIYLVGPCGMMDDYYVVRAATVDDARKLVQIDRGSKEMYPVEITGEAIVDAFPRIILKQQQRVAFTADVVTNYEVVDLGNLYSTADQARTSVLANKGDYWDFTATIYRHWWSPSENKWMCLPIHRMVFNEGELTKEYSL